MNKITLLVILMLIFWVLSADIVIDEGFDSSTLPTGWTQENVAGNVSWMTFSGGHNGNPPEPHNGARNAYIFAESCTTKLITPLLNIGGSNGATLEFYHAHTEWAGLQDVLRIYYKDEPDDDWHLLETYDDNVTDWEYESIALPSESSSYYIAFEAECNWGHGMVVDDVVIEGEPSPVGIIEGHVYSETGIPLTGATVLVEDTGQNAETLPGGFYQILAIPEGTHPFFASLDGYGFDQLTDEVIAGETTTIDFYLHEYSEVMVQGTIVSSADGTPVQGADIHLEGFEDYDAESAANGQFIIPNVYSDNTYEITVSKDTYNPYETTITVEQTNLNLGELAIIPPIEISGWVNTTANPDSGLANAVVVLSGYEYHTVNTAATGEFLITEVYANEDYDISITFPNHNPYETSLDVEAEDIDLETVTLVSPVSLIGHVVSTNDPETGIEGAEIELSGYANHDTETDSLGNFTITDIYANENYDISITYPNHNPYETSLDVEAENIDLETVTLISPISLTGHVVSTNDPETGIEDAEIHLSGYAYHNAETDSLGNFTITDIFANEDYDIVIEFPDHNPYEFVVEVESENIDLGTIELIGPVTVSGYVYGSDILESGLADANITLSGYHYHSTTSDSTGYFEFTEVYANEDYQISAEAEGYLDSEAEVEVESIDLILDDIILTEQTQPAGNVNAIIVEENNAEIIWNQPGSGNYEFRYDDGNQQNEIGLNGPRAVIGAVHPYNAIINEVQWYLTNAHTHPYVKVFIFGLTYGGMPDEDNLLYQSGNISNIYNQWRTYTLPNPVEAPEGFFVGVCTPNYWTDVGTDNGEGEPWVFQPETQFACTDWQDGDWMDIEGVPGYGNLMIRAYGIKLGPPQNREFESYQVFRLPENEMDDMDEWELIAENLQDTTYTDPYWWHLEDDEYVYAVRCQHTNGIYSMTSFSNMLEKEEDPPEFEVIMHIYDPDGNPLEDADCDLESFWNDYGTYSDDDGIADFEIYPGIYHITIEHDDYAVYEQLDVLIEENAEMDIYLENTGSNSSEIVSAYGLSSVHPNPFNPETEICFNLESSELVDISVFNSRGQLVESICHNYYPSGSHSVVWKADSQPSGIYFIYFKTSSAKQIEKAVLLK